MNDEREQYPLSPMQHGMLFHYLSDPNSGVDIEQMVCTLREDLQIQAFERAWHHVVNMHDTLRTAFRWEGVEEPVQEVYPVVKVPFIVQDWRSRSDVDQQAAFQKFLRNDRKSGFDLTDAPLVRLTLFRLKETEFRLVWTFHHIIADGRSHQIVLEDVFAAYEAFAAGMNPPVRQVRPYRDFITWLRKETVSASKPFWMKLLEGFTSVTLVPPTMVAEHDDQGDSRHPEVETGLTITVTSALQDIARQANITLNTIVQGAWAMLLSRTCGEDDVLFGVTRACRHGGIENIEKMVGTFINTVPIRVRVAADQELIPWLQQLRQQHIDVRDHEHTPLVQIKSWSDIGRGSQLFESIVVFDNYNINDRMQAYGGVWKRRDFRLLEQTGFPLSLYGYGGAELLLKLVYDPAKHDRTGAAQIIGHLRTVLEEIASNPNRQLAGLPMISAAERRQILEEWNETRVDLLDESCIHRLFEQQAARTPNATAVVFGDDHITYGELNLRANRLAHYLREAGVRPDTPVGIHMYRSLDLIVGLLAIMKAGGAYLPLDPTYPHERLSYMLKDSGARVLVTQEKLLGSLDHQNGITICVEKEEKRIRDASSANLDGEVHGENLAYVIYTSGSTGNPKGVMVEHRNVGNFFVGMDRLIDHDPPGTWLAVTAISFDISVLELFWTLTRGFKVVLSDILSAISGISPVEKSGDQQGTRNGSLASLVRRHRITHLQCTPSLARMLVMTPEAGEALGLIGTILIGGEAFPASLARQLEGLVKGTIFNMYGPTESTVWSSVSRVENVGNMVPIGRPIANTKFYVVDQNLQPVPLGVPGELLIGGMGVVRGYLGQQELTAERFLPDPFANGTQGRVYRTGDRVRYLPDGRLEFLGRLDHQIKIRGHRVELGEIEITLSRLPGVREAVVIVREDVADEQRLVAYMTKGSGVPPSAEEFRSLLRKKLPDHMVPSAFVFMESLPLTPNGKVNRRALPKPELIKAPEQSSFVPPRSITEESLAEQWKEVLGIDAVGLQDNFFDLGGHSLSAVQMINRIRQKFDVDLPLAVFSNSPNLSNLAMKVDLARIERTLKDLTFPTRFAVELCAECNLACSMCHHPQMKRPKGKMPFELWQRCADQIAAISPSTQCWFSFCGEPLLEPDRLIRMIAYGKSVGLRSVNINTNGMLLTPDLAGPIIDSGVDLVVFGIDGFSSETYERIRVNGTRDVVYANVEHFLATRQARGRGPEVQVQFIEMNENAHELEQFKNHWLKRGATVKFRRMLSWGGTFETSLSIPVEERIPCPWALTMMHVFWDGRVPRCPGDTEGQESAGNAWEEPLIDLWAKLGSYRDKHMTHRFDELPERCQSCTDWMTGSAERIAPNKELRWVSSSADDQ